MLTGPLLLALAGFGAGMSQASSPAIQTAQVAEGRAIAAMNPGVALVLFERALAHDSTSYEATWRAAVALVDVAESAPPDSLTPARRDSVHLKAVEYARRAVALAPDGANGHFALAMALGRTALTKSKRERARYAAEVYTEATRAAELDSTHDGAQHVLGAWNAEIMRLSGLSRFFAKTLLGARVFGKASWDQAVSHLEESVRLDPARIVHRLELARVYADRKRYADARRELAAIEGLPDRTVMDPRYRREARELSADWQQK